MSDTPKRPDRLKAKRGNDKKWYLTLIAPNGERLLHSEGYENLSHVKALANERFPGLEVEVEDGSE